MQTFIYQTRETGEDRVLTIKAASLQDAYARLIKRGYTEIIVDFKR